MPGVPTNIDEVPPKRAFRVLKEGAEALDALAAGRELLAWAGARLAARVEALQAERDRYRAALEGLACYREGPEVTSSFDEPYAARVARAALEVKSDG